MISDLRFYNALYVIQRVFIEARRECYEAKRPNRIIDLLQLIERLIDLCLSHDDCTEQFESELLNCSEPAMKKLLATLYRRDLTILGIALCAITDNAVAELTALRSICYETKLIVCLKNDIGKAETITDWAEVLVSLIYRDGDLSQEFESYLDSICETLGSGYIALNYALNSVSE